MRKGIVLGLAACLLPGMAPAAIKAEMSADSVHVEFDEAMETWADARPAGVLLFPAIPLTCRWTDDSALDCDFPKDHPARLASAYRLTLPAMRTQQGTTLPARALGLETARPSLSASLWGVRWEGRRPRVRIDADQPLDLAAARKVLRLLVDGRPQPFRLEPRADGDGKVFDLVPGADAQGDAVLRVVPGLAGRGGVLRGRQDAELLRLELDAPPRLLGVGCGREGRSTVEIVCEPGRIDVRFSRPLDASSQARFAAALPTGAELVAWHESSRIQWDGPHPAAAPPGQSAELRVARPRSAFDLTVGPTLSSVDGVAFAPRRVRFRTTDIAPAIASPHRQLLLGGIPEAVPLTAVNAPAGLAVDARGVAADAARWGIAVPVGAVNSPVAFADPRVRDMLGDGGWVRVEARLGRGYGPSWDAAAPQLDVAAFVGADELLVWAHDWDTGAAEKAARVELVLLDNANGRVVARAKTDRDGVARVTLGAGFALDRDAAGRTEWVVRVESGAGRNLRRAVLPVGTANDYRYGLGRSGNERAWGITDRPLYRAGDTVRFRIWPRLERAGRLLATSASKAASTLHLLDLAGTDVLTWPATPGTDGWAGDVVIPEHATDGMYCITPLDDEPESGACFYVGTFRAQDLWVEAQAEDRVLRAGDVFDIRLTGGYYSGGPAAALQVRSINAFVTGLPLAEAFPAFSEFTFIDVGGRGARRAVELQLPDDTAATDAQGMARLALPVHFKQREGKEVPAFGRLQATAELALDAREGTVSPAARARFAAFDSYVGLRLEPRWPDAATPIRVEAVVIDAEGRALDGRRGRCRHRLPAGQPGRRASRADRPVPAAGRRAPALRFPTHPERSLSPDRPQRRGCACRAGPLRLGRRCRHDQRGRATHARSRGRGGPPRFGSRRARPCAGRLAGAAGGQPRRACRRVAGRGDRAGRDPAGPRPAAERGRHRRVDGLSARSGRERRDGRAQAPRRDAHCRSLRRARA